ncbi:MAG: hypothetical protein WBP85_05625 [Terracidiphilus sp.]
MKGPRARKLNALRLANCYWLLPLVFFGWQTARHAIAQSPVPVATYKINAVRAIKDPEGHEFVWKVAPDDSLIILIAQPDGRWTIKRITEWQTQSPKEHTNSFFDALPKSEKKSFISFDDPLIDPEGRYILVHRRAMLKNPPPMTTPDGVALVAVLELQTLGLVHKAQGRDLRGTYLFTPQGTLLRVTWSIDRHFLYEVAALTVPGLEEVASCKYNDKLKSPISLAYLERESGSCPAFLRFANLSSLDELTGLEKLNANPGPTVNVQDIPGPNRYCAPLSGTEQQALFRCGNVHFDLGDGVFIVLWRALAALSVPEGKILLSLPLSWNDTESSGLFAQADGTRYLIVRHGLELRTYRLP